jgi:hypothetical protein
MQIVEKSMDLQPVFQKKMKELRTLYYGESGLTLPRGSSAAEVRDVARRAQTRLFEPQASQRPAWDEAMERFRAICQARA